MSGSALTDLQQMGSQLLEHNAALLAENTALRGRVAELEAEKFYHASRDKEMLRQGEEIAALREQLEQITEVKNDYADDNTRLYKENGELQEQLARMPVVVGYVDKNELTIPYLQVGTWSRKPQASYATPIYIDLQEPAQ